MRERSQATFLFTIILALLLCLAKAAHAHDWYTGTRNPVNGQGCCGGKDCHPLMTDELNRLTEDKDNYIIDGTWKFPKKEAMPAKGSRDHNQAIHKPVPKDGRFESGYSYCIWGGKARCFFFPTGA